MGPVRFFEGSRMRRLMPRISTGDREGPKFLDSSCVRAKIRPYPSLRAGAEPPAFFMNFLGQQRAYFHQSNQPKKRTQEMSRCESAPRLSQFEAGRDTRNPDHLVRSVISPIRGLSGREEARPYVALADSCA